jgi:hypothetical protein
MVSHVVAVKMASIMISSRRGVEVKRSGYVVCDCSFAGFMEMDDDRVCVLG